MLNPARYFGYKQHMILAWGKEKKGKMEKLLKARGQE